MRYSCVLLLATSFFVQKSTGAAQLIPSCKMRQLRYWVHLKRITS
jgi:hypothetical protein